MTPNLIKVVNTAVYLAEIGVSQLDEYIYYLNGMSSPKVRRVLNNLNRYLLNPNYLEVGSWRGSTIISAAFKNKGNFICIDDFSQFNRIESWSVNPLIGLVSDKEREYFLPSISPRDELLSKIKTIVPNVSFIEGDFHNDSVLSQISHNIDIYLYDGEHSYQNQYDGIKLMYPYLKNNCIVCVDDWTEDPKSEVRIGTYDAIRDCNMKINFEWNGHSKENGDITNWWNGFWIGVLSK